MSETETLPCPSCGQDGTDHIPVWESPSDYESGNPPDYLGCVECNTMLPYDNWWPPNGLLGEIRRGDREATNGGHYVGPDRRDEAERLVDEGKVVRLRNPAGVSPIYVPMDSDHYSDERLERLRERQSTDTDKRTQIEP